MNTFRRGTRWLNQVYRFLPVQLLLLHWRKFQLILVFWVILGLTITGHFAAIFGASSLFLAPEYQGEINSISFFLLGAAMGVFIMAWHITTFIVHSRRVPFMGAVRQAFLKYCLNNSLTPLLFLLLYSSVSIPFLWNQESHDPAKIILLQLSFYLGIGFIILVSFAYFFRVDRDLLKLVLSKITNPSRIRALIPYDSLDYEVDILRAETYITGKGRIQRFDTLEPYHPRLLQTVLRRHHRNAITATLFSLVLLWVMGIFMDDPRLRVPAGAGFLLLFSLIMGVVGAMKYFLRSWELFGWGIVIAIMSWGIQKGMVDFRSMAYGLDYEEGPWPAYTDENLKSLFTDSLWIEDLEKEQQRMALWQSRMKKEKGYLPPLVVILVSGGGSRSAYWTFNVLQQLDKASGGRLFDQAGIITGASGGMIGASYWRELHRHHLEEKREDPYREEYTENIGKDLLNAIIFSFASVDLINPFHRVSIAGKSYSTDRGYAMEQELIRNTKGLLDGAIGDYREAERQARIPALIIQSTIINDGRKLLLSNLPLSYLGRPEYNRHSLDPLVLDAIDFGHLFGDKDPYQLRLATALRMNASFPFILPVIHLPSRPEINLMDIGLRDNFGVETVSRYLHHMDSFFRVTEQPVLVLEIRDTREHEVFPSTPMDGLGNMLFDPLFVIQNKWEPFQSYTQGYIKDLLISPSSTLRYFSFSYIPEQKEKAAALNFHLSSREKSDLLRSWEHPLNQIKKDSFIQALTKRPFP